MKKRNLLLIAGVLMGSVLSAQNLVKNGNFEQEEYVDELDGQIYSVHTWQRGDDGVATAYIPGWDRVTDAAGNYLPIVVGTTDDPKEPVRLYNAYEGPADKWCVYAGIAEHEGIIGGDPDNVFYLDMRRYQWNGWSGAMVNLTQTIDVVAGETYDISFLYAVEVVQSRVWNAELNRNITVCDAADDSEIYQFMLSEDVVQQDWTEIKDKFTAPASCTQIKLKIGVRSRWDAGQGQQDYISGIQVDNLSITKSGGSGVEKVLGEKIQVSAINGTLSVKGANPGDKISVINLVGQEVLNSTVSSSDYSVPVQLQKGIYIIKINNASRKVII